MKKGLLIGLSIGLGTGAALALVCAPRRDRADRNEEPRAEPPPERFALFRGRVRLRFEDTAESIKPSI